MIQSVAEAVEILGLYGGANDADAVRKAARRMKARWHPDRVAARGAEAVAEYEARFKQVCEAEEYLLEQLEGQSRYEAAERENAEDLERNTPSRWEELKARWPEMRKSGRHVTKEEQVLFEGWSRKAFLDLIRFEKADRARMALILSLGLFLWFVVAIGGVFLLAFVEMFAGKDSMAYQAGVMAWAICLLLLLPAIVMLDYLFHFRAIMAFLPGPVYRAFEWVYENTAERVFLSDWGSALAERIPDGLFLIVNFINNVFVFLVGGIQHVLALLLLPAEGIGRVVKRYRLYAGISESDIKRILDTPPEELTRTQRIYLRHLAEVYEFQAPAGAR